MNSKILLIITFLFIFSLGLFAQQQTADGGYIIGGSGDSFTHGGKDLFVFKLDVIIYEVTVVITHFEYFTRDAYDLELGEGARLDVLVNIAREPC